MSPAGISLLMPLALPVFGAESKARIVRALQAETL